LSPLLFTSVTTQNAAVPSGVPVHAAPEVFGHVFVQKPVSPPAGPERQKSPELHVVSSPTVQGSPNAARPPSAASPPASVGSGSAGGASEGAASAATALGGETGVVDVHAKESSPS